MPRTSLYDLAKQTRPGDKIRWVGENSEVEKPNPRTAQVVELGLNYVEIEAKGPNGGIAGFRVEEGGSSEAWYGEEERLMGAVSNAELIDKDLFVFPWG